MNRPTVPYSPALGRHVRAFNSFVRTLPDSSLGSLRHDLELSANSVLTLGDLRLLIAESLLLDLTQQGWSIATAKPLELAPPDTESLDRASMKGQVRAAHLVERSAHLRQPAVRTFVTEMEQQRLAPKGWRSIFSLMRDGRVLAEQIRETLSQPADGGTSSDRLQAVIDPYLQFVEPGATCSHTGLALNDIWRYFRLTWVNAPKSVPGRSMAVLVRDAAAENHPVIGIAALSSPVVQQSLRDKWIGWDSDSFFRRLAGVPTTQLGRWLVSSIDDLIAGLYLDDLVVDGTITRREIAKPSPAALESLQEAADEAMRMHHLYPEAAEHKRGHLDWRGAAEKYLFRSKRAATLARLLKIRVAFRAAGVIEGTRAELIEAIRSPQFRDATGQLVRLLKAERVGIGMMDITVCGAIPPYTHLLGGKLVCGLLFSPEVVGEYRRRYSDQDSIIASSMRGAAVRRVPNLVLLCTTSLYGSGSSQYNRIKIPLHGIDIDSEDALRYEELGLSKGYGSFHVSSTTVRLIDLLLSRRVEGRRVNSIFGEGVNPLMRKIREAVSSLGLPADALLMHGNQRVVYAVPLAKNFREVLLGIAHRPAYYIPLEAGQGGTGALAAFWRRRWLEQRVSRPGVLEAVESHKLTYPVTHGARVQLGDLESSEEGQLAFFDEH